MQQHNLQETQLRELMDRRLKPSPNTYNASEKYFLSSEVWKMEIVPAPKIGMEELSPTSMSPNSSCKDEIQSHPFVIWDVAPLSRSHYGYAGVVVAAK